MKTSTKIIVSGTLLLAFVINVADARIFLGPGQTLGTTPAQQLNVFHLKFVKL
jgi:hypothetical protein